MTTKIDRWNATLRCAHAFIVIVIFLVAALGTSRASDVSPKYFARIISDGVDWRRAEFEKLAPRDIDNGSWVVFKLRNLHDIDQWTRGAVMHAFKQIPDATERKSAEPTIMSAMIEADRKNLEDLKEIVSRHGWPTRSKFGPEADTNAWIIVQHATFDLPYMKEVLAMLEPLVKAGESQPGSYALLLDRVAVNERRPQTFGTQGSCGAAGPWIADPIEDEEGLDARRMAIGLPPIAKYAETMQAFCP